MTSLKSEHVMVVAIDFGTTYSGYAFSLGTEFESQPTHISSNKPWIASQGLVSHKTPTCVLLKPDMTFHKFGYEAEDCYNMLAQDEDHDHTVYYYFRRFKMLLHSAPYLRRELLIEDETGKQMQALQVFVHGIKYLMKHALSTINSQGKLVDHMDIHWVITVPAIWSDGAKQFMREAAKLAGIEDNNLSIALEPEAAAVYCRYLPAHQLAGDQTPRGMFEPGSRYMVLDLGGGTVDITVHKVLTDNSVCEIHAPSGGPWGGTRVDDAFLKFLKSVLGEKLMTDFFLKHMDEYIDMFRDFELKKRKVQKDMTDTPSATMKVPFALFEFYRQKKHEELSKAFDNAEYKGKVSIKGDKIKIDSSIMQSFFKLSLTELVDHIREILAEEPVRGTDTFIMVGGFSESPIVQDTIRNAFPNMKVIIPFDAGLAVLKGAVIFGHAPMVMTSRVCRYTYGMAVSKPFVKGVYPEKKMAKAGGMEIVKDVFHKFVTCGDFMDVGKEVDSPTLTVPDGLTETVVRVFSCGEKDPMFVTDKSCKYLGEIRVTLPEVVDRRVRTVRVKMVFGGTELMVEAVDNNTGKVFRSRFDFLKGN